MFLAKDFSTQGTATLAAGGLDVQASNTSIARTSSVFDHGGGSVLGRVKGFDSRRSMDRPNLNLDAVDGSRPGRALKIFLFKTCWEVYPLLDFFCILDDAWLIIGYFKNICAQKFKIIIQLIYICISILQK